MEVFEISRFGDNNFFIETGRYKREKIVITIETNPKLIKFWSDRPWWPHHITASWTLSFLGVTMATIWMACVKKSSIRPLQFKNKTHVLPCQTKVSKTSKFIPLTSSFDLLFTCVNMPFDWSTAAVLFFAAFDWEDWLPRSMVPSTLLLLFCFVSLLFLLFRFFFLKLSYIRFLMLFWFVVVEWSDWSVAVRFKVLFTLSLFSFVVVVGGVLMREMFEPDLDPAIDTFAAESSKSMKNSAGGLFLLLCWYFVNGSDKGILLPFSPPLKDMLLGGIWCRRISSLRRRCRWSGSCCSVLFLALNRRLCFSFSVVSVELVFGLLSLLLLCAFPVAPPPAVDARFILDDMRKVRGKCLKLSLNDLVCDRDFLYSSNMLSKSKLTTCWCCCLDDAVVEPRLASFRKVVTVALAANLEKWSELLSCGLSSTIYTCDDECEESVI